jgi:hypothetical protein
VIHTPARPVRFRIDETFPTEPPIRRLTLSTACNDEGLAGARDVTEYDSTTRENALIALHQYLVDVHTSPPKEAPGPNPLRSGLQSIEAILRRWHA